jgi:nicotinamidase-related amidase
MTQAAVLLMDLQRDFLDGKLGRLPVDEPGARAVIQVANEVLSGRILATGLPILVTNQYPANASLGNFFRHGAAVCGTTGAEFDPRLWRSGSERVIIKSSPSAFTNPELERSLRAHGVRDLFVLGVFAEGCVRSTVLAALQRGYRVYVLADAVASNAAWKKSFALWSMARAGAHVLPRFSSLHPADSSAWRKGAA